MITIFYYKDTSRKPPHGVKKDPLSVWMGRRLPLPNCIVVPLLHFASVARAESWEKFNFSSVDGSASQSNHMPVQALANQTVCLCVRGGRLMWLVVVRAPDTPTGMRGRTGRNSYWSSHAHTFSFYIHIFSLSHMYIFTLTHSYILLSYYHISMHTFIYCHSHIYTFFTHTYIHFALIFILF